MKKVVNKQQIERHYFLYRWIYGQLSKQEYIAFTSSELYANLVVGANYGSSVKNR